VAPWAQPGMMIHVSYPLGAGSNGASKDA
jgi:hypothetical protein